ncbi:carbohydrate ABC transporter permease [Vibrio nigripulchritudo]|uniref:carbohydrate ABC transporter permease n=1 Tax=Vibrio nigripulchritudo TaxID=28173 RepID=UPI0003B1D3B0|nr:carbohydrate ABC transporter permease [Vibrio nigripulchritudo]CCN69688.1 putative ABC-type sugar transport systems,permease component [Vibrio nigripulchritudo SFn118]
MNQIQITPWSKIINGIASWLLGLLWVLPLLYMVWAAFHSGSDAISFDLSSPWRLDNFFEAWTMAPFVTYMWNTFCFVTLLLALQIVVCTLAAYALARLEFKGKSIIFGAILLQLMIMPEALISENYQRIANLNAIDTYWAIALPYIASAFGIFLLRQTFMQVPQELEDAARVEGLSRFATILKVYVPLAKPTYLAYGLVSISYHWNNFLWPVVVTNTEQSRPITVGIALFGSPEIGVDWGVLSAGTLISISPLLAIFLIFQKQFMQSFMNSGLK